MKKVLLSVLLSALCSSAPSAVYAQAAESAGGESGARRGLVTSSQCPFICRDLNLDSASCRQWQQGDKCMVEDFTQPAGHRSLFRINPQDMVPSQGSAPQSAGALTDGRRGLVTSSSCPYDCKMAGLTTDICREWQQGDKCMVEDFTQPAGHRSMLRVP